MTKGAEAPFIICQLNGMIQSQSRQTATLGVNLVTSS